MRTVIIFRDRKSGTWRLEQLENVIKEHKEQNDIVKVIED